MFLTVKEMTALCTFHAGTRSETLALLRKAQDGRPEIMETITNLTQKLESTGDDEAISLYFDPE